MGAKIVNFSALIYLSRGFFVCFMFGLVFNLEKRGWGMRLGERKEGGELGSEEGGWGQEGYGGVPKFTATHPPPTSVA